MKIDPIMGIGNISPLKKLDLMKDRVKRTKRKVVNNFRMYNKKRKKRDRRRKNHINLKSNKKSQIIYYEHKGSYILNGVYNYKLAVNYFSQRKNRRRLKTLKYDLFLKTDYWKTVRKMKLEKQKYCSKCKSTSNLQIHHKTYKHRGHEINHLEDLDILCDTCHNTTHIELKATKTKYNSTTIALSNNVQLTAISW